MAETENLKLALPGSNEYVDIADLNSNFQKIDAAVVKALANADVYDASETYVVGAYCSKDGKMYRCTTAITEAEAWTADHWTETSITAELLALSRQLSETVGKTHASQHASGGSDPITPAAIGAAPASHVSDATVHVTADERAAWNGKAAGTHASQHASGGSDPITPASIGAIPSAEKGAANGVATLGSDGKVPTSQLPEISSVKTYTATIGTTWTEDENTGVKYQSVAISGVLATHTAKVDHSYTGSGTSDDYAAFVEAENQYLTYITNGYAETYDGGVKFYIFGDANTVEITIVVEVA